MTGGINLDFTTLLVVIVVSRLIQAGGLFYVWQMNRKYGPAGLWALGSVLIAAGTLIIAARGPIPFNLSVLGGNVGVFVGAYCFCAGVVIASGKRPPWSLGLAAGALALLSMAWFTVVDSSIVGRTATFVAITVALDGYAAVAAWRNARGRTGSMQRFVAGLLAAEITFVCVRLFSVVRSGPDDALPSNGYQTAFALAIIAITVMMTLALAFITNLIDIEKRERSEAMLKDEISRSTQLGSVLDTALANMNQGLAMYDAGQGLIVCNDNYMKPYGLSKQQARPGMLLTDIARLRIANGYHSGTDPEAYIESRKRIAEEMLRVDTDQVARLNDGRFIRVTSHPLESGGWVMTNEDVTEQKRRDAEIAYLAHHDTLTGLANRAHFKNVISQAVTALRTGNKQFSVMMLDLDRFKRINDTLGHAAGDALLKEVANRLKSAVREVDLVARLGGDEFAIIQTTPRGAQSEPGSSDLRDGAIALACRILDALNEPIDVGGNIVFAGTSIGIALALGDGFESDDLLKKADLALYEAKSAGRSTYRIFDARMMDAVAEQTAIEADLRAGIERGEFELRYQDIFDLSSGKPAGYEALLRWNHPRLGSLSPERFIQAAEESGLIVTLGEWVVQRACSDAATWPDDLRVAVKVSAVQFKKGNLIDVVLFGLADSGLSPDRLEIEVTESILLNDDADYVSTLEQLKSIGVGVSLDDFGTGYSSLGYLTKFKFNRVKIHRSFVTDITRNSDSMAIVGAVASLARALDIGVVAEGVETPEQVDILRAAGVRYAQGSLFDEPRPASQLSPAKSMGISSGSPGAA